MNKEINAKLDVALNNINLKYINTDSIFKVLTEIFPNATISLNYNQTINRAKPYRAAIFRSDIGTVSEQAESPTAAFAELIKALKDLDTGE